MDDLERVMKNKYLILGDGSSPHIVKWVKELVLYFDVYLISLNGVSDEILEYLNRENVFILNEQASATGGNHKLIFKLPQIRKRIKEIEPDYINAHYLSSYGFLAALSKSSIESATLIQSTWGSDVLLEPFLNFIRKSMAKYSLKKADFVTSDSWHMADVVEQLVGKKETIVFPFGFEKIEKFTMEKEKLIFSNRALKDFYNIKEIIKWFSKQEDEYQLVIANEGIEKNNLKKLVQQLSLSSRVLFVGYLSEEEQKGYYQKAKYYVSIPDSDATSVSLLEAMQYGAVPIVSNIPANREWVLDGVNGSYFDKNKKLNEIKIEEDFAKINQNILTNRALFSKSIKEFIIKVTK